MRFLVLWLGLAAFGCKVATSPPTPVLDVTADRTDYVFDHSGGPLIVLTVRNLGASAVALASCGGIVLTEAEAFTAEG